MAEDIKFGDRIYAESGGSYYKITDAYANQLETFISFYHVPSGKEVYFKAFITSFNESFNSDWTSEQVFGRADPIQTFKQNQRNIALNFKVPAAYDGEAYDNLGKIQKLIQFLYPTYTDVAQANTITQSPLVRMKVMNLLNRAPSELETSGGRSASEIYNDYSSGGSGADSGLLGVITNLTVNHNLEGDDGVIEKAQNTVLPKLLDVAVSFTVIHEHPVGWDISGSFGSLDNRLLFPYGVQLFDVGSVEENLAATSANAKILEAESELADTQFDTFGNPIIPETNSNTGDTDNTAGEAESKADEAAALGGRADDSLAEAGAHPTGISITRERI